MDSSSSTSIHPLSTYTPQDDASKFIRTYAKDVAAFSGEIGGAAVPAAPVAPTVPPAPKDDGQAEGVSLPEFDSSPVNHPDGASPKEFVQETVDLTAADSDGIFANESAKAPAPVPEFSMPLMPQVTIAPTHVVESSIPSAPSPATVPQANADADREAILARLRAKVGSEKQGTPAFELEPMRAAAPDFSMTPEPVLPMPQVSKEPLPAPVPVAAQPSSDLHTYSSDFADRIDTQQSSTFSVLAAQSDAGQTPRPVQAKRRLIPLLAGGAMLVIGIGAIASAYLLTQKNSVVPTVAGIPSLIKYDESVEVKGEGTALMQAIAQAGEGGSVPGNVVVTYVTLATTSGNGIPQPGGVLIQKLGLNAPDILLRNIDQSSTVGVVRAGSESRPFMILKVNSYERTFAGMLAWEPAMRDDLAAFYPAYASVPQTGTSTSSTTPLIQAPDPTTFTDAVVANYDVRILRDASGRSRMLYGYRGKDTLIIARDEAAFTALVSRLNASGQ